jgi:hypothetical protein
MFCIFNFFRIKSLEVLNKHVVKAVFNRRMRTKKYPFSSARQHKRAERLYSRKMRNGHEVLQVIQNDFYKDFGLFLEIKSRRNKNVK